MRTRRLAKKRLRFETLEGRRVLSALPVLHAAGVHAATQSQSTNWSGYAITTANSAVSQVAGSWTVPTLNVAGSGSGTTYSSVWVGIDGYNSSTVEQLGTEQDVVNGAASYYAWYEMYPHNSYNINNQTTTSGAAIPNTSFTIKPGDTITASVVFSGTNQFALTIKDGSEYFTITQSMSNAKRNSAEWVVEAPSSGGILPLADFQSVTFTTASAVINGSTVSLANDSSYQDYIINMVSDSGTTEASTTVSGSTITVTYVAPTNPPPPPSGHHRHGRGYYSDNLSSSAQATSKPALDALDDYFAMLGRL